MLQIDSGKELTSYGNSGFMEGGNLDQLRANYLAYIEFKKSGFLSKSEQQQAIKMGFTSAKEFDDFKASGCKDKPEYEKKKLLPKYIQECEKDLGRNVKDLKEAIKNQEKEHIIEYGYTKIEILAKLLYLKRNKATLPIDLDLETILKQFEVDFNLKLIDESDMKKGQLFLEELADLLIGLIEKMPE
jgi:hypothetical protein